MDETTKEIVGKITVRYSVPTKIPSGDLCTVFYDCFQLSPNDLARLAAQAVGDLPNTEFDVAVGIAYSGILFAAAVAGGRQVVIFQKDGEIFGPSLKDKRVVIVDDVVHRGRRMGKAAEKVKNLGGLVVGYVCIVDRSDGTVASPSCPVWSAFQAGME